MTGTQILYCISHLKGYGPSTLRKLIAANLPEHPKEIPAFLNTENNDAIKLGIDNGMENWARSISSGIGILSPLDALYPSKLRELTDFPPLISYKGALNCLDRPTVAIIGSRDASAYALKAGPRLSKYFVEAGFTIVSGLAKGCDALAHRTAVGHHASTVAVIPSGLPLIYPSEHRSLADAILQNNGLLLSEQPYNKVPRASDFIQRDRLQSALSLGLAVIETKVDGGTMHTVRFAKAQQKAVACLYPQADLPDGNALIVSEFNGIKLQDRDDIQNYIRSLLDEI